MPLHSVTSVSHIETVNAFWVGGSPLRGYCPTRGVVSKHIATVEQYAATPMQGTPPQRPRTP